jgi:predicted Zn-dependent protease
MRTLHVSLALALLCAPALASSLVPDENVADLARGMRAARRDGRPDDAIAMLQGAPAAWLADTRIAGERIQALLDARLVEQALAVNVASGDLAKAALPFFVARTRLLLLSADPEPLLAAVDQLLIDRPGHPDLLALRVHTLSALGRWAEANTQLEVLVHDLPAPMHARLSVDVLLAKGRVHVSIPDQLERGIPLLERALALQPARVDVRSELVVALAQWQHADRAEQLVREVLDDSQGADRRELVFALGMTYGTMLRDADAEECFLRVLAEEPENSRASAALAKCWLRAGRLDAARELLEQSLERDSSDVRALFVLAELEMSVGAPGASERALRDILEENPNSLKALYMLSRALARQGHSLEQREVIASYTERRSLLASR